MDFHNVLVVAAHPDDEILGCGGTLAKLSQQGAHITIVLLGEGPTSRNEPDPGTVRSGASVSALTASAILGVSDVRFLALPDNRFDTIPLLDIVQAIEAISAEIVPDVVFTHHAGDMNQDHRVAHQAVMTAFRPLPQSKPVALLGFEILSSTEYAPAHTAPFFAPTIFVNITSYLNTKQKALEAYSSEMRLWPHPRSHEGIAHLAALRGCACGYEAAEAFVLYRSVIK